MAGVHAFLFQYVVSLSEVLLLSASDRTCTVQAFMLADFNPCPTSAASSLPSASGTLSSAWSSLCVSFHLFWVSWSASARTRFFKCFNQLQLFCTKSVTHPRNSSGRPEGLLTFSRRVGTRNQAATFLTSTAGVHRAHLTRGSGIFSKTSIFHVSRSCISAHLLISLQCCQLDATFQHQSHHCHWKR